MGSDLENRPAKRRPTPRATLRIVLLLAVSAAVAVVPSRADGRIDQADAGCGALPDTLDVTLTFTVSGERVDEPSHSTFTVEWNQTVSVRGTLAAQHDDGVYDVSHPGSNVQASGTLAHNWREVYKKTDITGEGGANGGTLDPASLFRVLVDDDVDGACRFTAQYQPIFTGVQKTHQYSGQPAQDGVISEGFGSFTVHGELDGEWRGTASASADIVESSTVMVGDDELSGPQGATVSVELTIGELSPTPTAELLVEHLDVPSTEAWVEVPIEGTFEGNVVRLSALVGNPSDAATARVEIRDEAADRTIAGPIDVVAEPGDNEYQWELDTEGLAWDAGQPAEDLDLRLVVELYGTTAEDRTTLAVRPRPVVLVHGWNSDASGWSGYADLLQQAEKDWEVHAVGDGRFDGRMQTGSIANPFDRGLGLVPNAGELSTYVEDLRGELDAQRVDLVAHSMGGLISRYYVAALMEIPNGIPAATRLVMLGTPNLGSPCASIIPHRSAFDLDPEVIAQFNAVVRATNGVRYSILAGDSWPTTCHAPGEGDMVVQVTSAFGLPYVTDRQRTDTDHVSMTGSAGDARAFVLPRLTAPVEGARGLRAGSTSVEALGQDEEVDREPGPDSEATDAGRAPVVLTADTAEVSSAAPVDLPVLVDDLDQVAASIGAQEDVTVELLPPGGEPLDEGLGATTGDDRPIASTDPVADPTPGTWTLRLSSERRSPVTVAYAVVGSTTAGPSLDVEVDGDDVVVSIDGDGASVDSSASVAVVLVVDRAGGDEADDDEADDDEKRVLEATVDEGRIMATLPDDLDGASLVVRVETEDWQRLIRRSLVADDAFAFTELVIPDREPLVTPPEAVDPSAVPRPGDAADTPTDTGVDAAAGGSGDEGGAALPVALLVIVAVAAVGGGAVVVARRNKGAERPLE